MSNSLVWNLYDKDRKIVQGVNQCSFLPGKMLCVKQTKTLMY